MQEKKKDLTETLYSLFLKVIISDLKDNTVDIPMAKKLANEFIALEPFTTIEECRDKIEQFVEKFPRFDNLKLYINNYLEEQKVNSVIERMKKHIKDNDIDKALEVANLSS